MNNKGYWLCRRCNYQEPVSKYKQSHTRFCPKCFGLIESRSYAKKRSTVSNAHEKLEFRQGRIV